MVVRRIRAAWRAFWAEPAERPLRPFTWVEIELLGAVEFEHLRVGRISPEHLKRLLAEWWWAPEFDAFLQPHHRNPLGLQEPEFFRRISAESFGQPPQRAPH